MSHESQSTVISDGNINYASFSLLQKSTGDRRQLYEQRRQQETAKAAVHSNLFRIVKLVNDKGVSYIPPFKLSSEVSVTFDFEVSVPTQAAKSSGKSWFNNVLNAGPEGFLSF